MSRHGINADALGSDTQTAVRAEQIRSSIINSIQSIDRSLPRGQNPTAYDLVDALPHETGAAIAFTEGELRDTEGELLRRLNGVGPVNSSVLKSRRHSHDARANAGTHQPARSENYLKQPQPQSTECDAMLCDILQVPEQKKKPAHSTAGLESQRKSAAEQLQHAATPAISRGHT
jgi:hypothetical protein